VSEHWDRVYAERAPADLSWHQTIAAVSLELIEALGVERSAAVIDVGGGASTLADSLVARGFTDVSVLDVSELALAAARRRVGDEAGVRWLHADMLTWQPERRYDLWHDRAAFHFLVTAADQESYLRTMRAALVPGGVVVLATFAPDAPPTCSGLPVVRRTAVELADALGPGFEQLKESRELHTTPRGTPQPFTWIAGRL
jgi:trans-aconitate methyltransferase